MVEYVKDLFASDIHRRIEEVIKVDQNDEQIVQDEISEYVVTQTINRHYTDILEIYAETPNKPHEGIAVWVSGFFGSGKSSFAKMLGLALSDRKIAGTGAASLFGPRTGDQKIQVLLSKITEQIPTHSVIFDVSTDRGIRTGNQTLTEIMYRLFLQSLGYAKDLDLSELEIILESEGKLKQFETLYQEMFGKEWNQEKGKIAPSIAKASKVMHQMEPDVYSTPETWLQAAKNRADISPSLLAKRCQELMKRRSPDKNLIFVIDEVGQFVARDIQKMLDLQGIVQKLGVVGRGKIWIAITSQEKLTELVGGLDDKRVELARLMDRFPSQVHLEPSDISEVTSKRVLSKNASAEKVLRDLFTEHRGRLIDNTKLTADIKLPELTTEGFINLYPLLPYQIDLIIQVVSGLRTQGGTSKHVGGANRTIIKLAQQLLIHPEIRLAEIPIGTLVRIDQIYDLVSGNISSEIRGKIDAIKNQVPHPFAQPVAKAICLLQYVKSIHRTSENISATLHSSVEGDSCLPDVKAALDALVASHNVRHGEDGYRIPTPAEDDWERQRTGLSPKPGDMTRKHAELITSLWQPQPTHNFHDTKMFKAGLYFNNRSIVEGDIPFHLTLAEAGKEYEKAVDEMRKRSQSETKSVFWGAPINGAIDRETVEVYRSTEILSSKERNAQTKDETALVSEEKIRSRRHQDELKRLLKQAFLSGTIFFRGNDRSPGDTASDIGKTAEYVLSQALPDVFDRFQEAAARIQKKDLETLMSTENLRGLTPVFSSLGLVREEGSQTIFNTENGPLAEIFARIENRCSYGENANGRYLAEEFSKEPFGWDFEVIRLFVVSLLRAGKIEATSKGQLIESALSLEAKETFTNNNLFRQTSFRPKVGIDFSELLKAAEAYKEIFGKEIPELEQSVVAHSIRSEISAREENLHDAYLLLVQHALPGNEILKESVDQMRAIRTAAEDQVILTFNTSYKGLDEAINRANELKSTLNETRLYDLKRAQIVLERTWPFLQEETDLEDAAINLKWDNMPS